MSKLLVCDLGTMAYAEALGLQRAVAKARISGAFSEDLLLLVEHPPVVTLGRSSKDAHLLASPALLAARGIEVHEAERGGDVTFHGPGQLVGYPIIDLKRHTQDLHWYLRKVEEALISGMSLLGMEAGQNVGYTGVWTHGRKLASIGVHARDWVTWHGFALNVSTDLSYFDVIVPCGIQDVQMTSVAEELGASADAALSQVVRDAVISGFASAFGLTPEPLDPDELERVAATVIER